MKRYSNRFYLVFIYIFSIILNATPAFSTEQEKKWQQLQRSLSQLNQELLNDSNKAQLELRKIQQLEQSIDTIGYQHYLSQQQIARKQASHEKISNHLKSLQQTNKILNDKINTYTKLIFKINTLSPTKLLFAESNFNTLYRLKRYTKIIHQQYQTLLKEQTEKITMTQQKQQELLALLQELNKLNTQQSKQLAHMKQHFKNRQSLLNKINNNLHLKKQKQALLKHDQAQLTKTLDQLNITSIQESTTANITKKIWPINKLDALRLTTNKNQHNVIFQTKPNTKVVAIANGVVVFAHWFRGYGLLLIIDHGNGMMSLYGHNQTILKKQHAVVKKGELIALAGQSGGYTKDSLYFEIRINGHPIDLKKWFNTDETILS